MSAIPKAKRVRLTSEDLEARATCGNCKSPLDGFGGERTHAFEVVDGDGVRRLFCSTTCKTFVYGSTPNPRTRG